MEHNTLLRHLLSTVAYRFRKTIAGMDATFYNFENRNGVRTPIQIIHHMSSVMTFCLATVKGIPREPLQELGMDDEVNRFYSLLKQVNGTLLITPIETDLACKLLQGPLADVLTHIGQIAMLRRMFNQPLTGENFMAAEIKTGQISESE